MMNEIDDAIFGLLEEPAKEPVQRRRVEEIPDALVLCIIEVTCGSCGNKYAYPKTRILGRYDKHRKKIKKWSSTFELLPRERIVIGEKSVCCQQCFEGALLNTYVVEVEQ